MISHLLSGIPYHEVPRPEVSLPRRPEPTGYPRADRRLQTYVPDRGAELHAARGAQ
jgi:hypothetical protein